LASNGEDPGLGLGPLATGDDSLEPVRTPELDSTEDPEVSDEADRVERYDRVVARRWR